MAQEEKMPIYSKTIQNDAILALIPQGTRKILILFCCGCINESLAFDNNFPLSLMGDNNTRIPYPSQTEAKRISHLLNENGFITKYTTLIGDMPVLCVFSSESITYISENEFQPDIILVLSCPAGAHGVHMRVCIPVFSVTEQVGTLAFQYSEQNGKRYITRSRVYEVHS